MGGKTILMGDKELAKWWVSVTHDDRFETICALARAELFEMNPPPDQVKGANIIIDTLTHFADSTIDGARKFPTPGLVHQMPERKTLPEPNKP